MMQGGRVGVRVRVWACTGAASLAVLGTPAIADAEPIARHAVEAGSSITYLANLVDPGVGMTWTEPGFDDSRWAVGVYGIGYDGNGTAADLLETTVPELSASVFTR